MTNHPVTPPPELVQQWLGEYFGTTVTGEISDAEHVLATKAARWGADQELEACVEWLQEQLGEDRWEITVCLRLARRPKPKSLSEQALEDLEAIAVSLMREGLPCNTGSVRRALERLQELEEDNQ